MSHYYIIDLSLIIEQPQILHGAEDRGIFVIPDTALAVFNHLNTQYKIQPHVLKHLIDLVERKRVELVDVGQRDVFQPYKVTDKIRTTSVIDTMLQTAMAAVGRKWTPFTVVTDNDVAGHELAMRGFARITSKEFYEGKTGVGGKEAFKRYLANQDAQYRADRHHFVLRSLALGSALAIVGALFVRYCAVSLLNTVPIWGTLALVPLLGVTLYWYRERFRLSYGSFECVAGFVFACYDFLPRFDYSEFGSAQALHLLGGLYVMVRGLDNVGKGLQGTALGARWARLFAERSQSK